MTAKSESLLWVSDSLQQGESLSICLGGLLSHNLCTVKQEADKVSVINPT